MNTLWILVTGETPYQRIESLGDTSRLILVQNSLKLEDLLNLLKCPFHLWEDSTVLTSMHSHLSLESSHFLKSWKYLCTHLYTHIHEQVSEEKITWVCMYNTVERILDSKLDHLLPILRMVGIFRQVSTFLIRSQYSHYLKKERNIKHVFFFIKNEKNLQNIVVTPRRITRMKRKKLLSGGVASYKTVYITKFIIIPNKNKSLK